MKVLMALPELVSGGVENYVIRITPLLRDRGVEPVVVSAGGKLVEQLWKNGVHHVRYDMKSKNPFNLLRILQMRRYIKQQNFSLVHAHSRVPAWILMPASMGVCPFVMSPHGQYRPHAGSRVVGLSKHIIVGAWFLKDHFRNHFKIPEERFHMAPYGIDLENFLFKEKENPGTEIVFGAAGRLSKVKGFDILFKALKLLKLEGKAQFRLVLAGAGEEEDFLKKQAKELGLSEVSFLGSVSDMQEFYGNIDALVISSRREGLPTTLLESMACGIPSICTRVGDIPRVIREGIEGFLCEPEDVESLYKAFQRMIESRDRMRDMGAGARERVESMHDIHRTADCIVEAYRNIVSRTS